jgi:putative transposase
VSDDLWAKIKPILAEFDPPNRMGRKRIDQRCALNGIIYRLRSGVQWNQLPKEFGDDSSVHRTFQRWVALEIFDRIWATLVDECEALGAVDWEWQAADAAMGKARLGGIWLAPTPPIVARTV